MLKITTTPHFQPEKEYIFKVLLGDLLGISYAVQYRANATDYELLLPNGATITIEDHFWKNKQEGAGYTAVDIPVCATATTNPFDDTPLTILFGNDRVAVGADHRSVTIGADLFAAAFFMLTRWEETVLPDRDTHDRFPAASALAFKYNFLNRPVVHEWAELIWHSLLQSGWTGQKPDRQYQVVLSCDVDHPRLWWHQGEKIRTLFGAFKRPQPFKEIYFWATKYLFNKKDPYDTLDLLMDWGESMNCRVQFNFLGDRPRSFDCWYPLRHPVVQIMMQNIAKRGHFIGFHPSREAYAEEQVFKHELASIRDIAPLPITTGRHHYLCFRAPATWRLWAENGLKIDSTLGYSEMAGFRSGICVPYDVFDIATRTMLPIKEQPLIVMDITLALYNQLTPEQAMAQIESLAAQVRRFDGELTILWHNSSINTPFWRPFFEAVSAGLSPQFQLIAH